MAKMVYNLLEYEPHKATAAMLQASRGHDTRKDKFLMQPQYITLTRRAKDITGQRFGRLVALGPVGHTPGRNAIWLCQCDCGNTTTVNNVALRAKQSQSCGCLSRQVRSAMHTTHGLRYDPIYSIWRGIYRRCFNPTHKSYAGYGGRGITICDEWRDDVQVFYDYVSRLPHYGEKGYSIDRIDNNGNYEPGNVRWATLSEQGRNRRTSLMLTYKGKTQSIGDWADELQISYGALKQRIYAGWDIERAFRP